jgi:transposase
MAKTIDDTQSDRKKYQLVTELLGLEELDVVGQRYDRKKGLHELYCVARWDVALCPKCLQLSNRIHDYPKQRRIHDAPLRGEKVLLVFDSRRFDCEHCKQPFTQEIADVVPDCTYTHRLYGEITNPKRKQDVATLAELYGIGYKVVERMLLNAGEAKLAQRRSEPLKVTRLGIDEIAQKKDMAISSSS